MKGTTIRRRFRTPRQLHTGYDKPKAATTLQAPSRAARMLALAHRIERLLDQGSVDSYSAAAEALGLTRARLTQLMKLLLLGPGIQGHLLGDAKPSTERALRSIVNEPNWDLQTTTLRRGASLNQGNHDE